MVLVWVNIMEPSSGKQIYINYNKRKERNNPEYIMKALILLKKMKRISSCGSENKPDYGLCGFYQQLPYPALKTASWFTIVPAQMQYSLRLKGIHSKDASRAKPFDNGIVFGWQRFKN